MAAKEKKIDAYIAKSADFAKPILNHIRDLIYKAYPDVEKKVKWGMLFLDYKGEMLCHIASFKQHAVMGFWKASLMKDSILLENAKSETAMGHLDKITSLKDLPSHKKITAWIREAMQLTDKGIKLPSKAKPTDKKELTVPDYFINALAKNKKAKQVFENFAYSHKRMATALEWIAEGKGKNWKY